MPSATSPNLFIVGAPKCGTTAWVEYLRTHPDIFFPQTKDECFFALDLPRFRLVRTKEEFVRRFKDSDSSRVVGGASAMHLFSTQAAQAIREFNPNAKILILLRNQEDYLPSLHNQFLREFADEIEDFETAWRLSGRRSRHMIPANCLEPRTLDYAAMGRFAEQVGRYLAAFPAEQVCVLRFEDWVEDPRSAYLQLLGFLGLEDDGRIDFPPVNRGSTYRSRTLARLVMNPPPLAQRAWRAIKAKIGPFGAWLYRAARSVGFRSSPGYRHAISPELRDQIKRYYAEDNRQLEKELKALTRPNSGTSGLPSTLPKR